MNYRCPVETAALESGGPRGGLGGGARASRPIGGLVVGPTPPIVAVSQFASTGAVFSLLFFPRQSPLASADLMIFGGQLRSERRLLCVTKRETTSQQLREEGVTTRQSNSVTYA